MECNIEMNGKYACLVMMMFFLLLNLSCFDSDKEKYIVVHEAVSVYRSVDELAGSTVRGNENVKAVFVLSQGEQVGFVDYGYTKTFMYIKVEFNEGDEGFVFNSPKISIVEVD
ncbi:hypothetical protein FRC96_12475 [Lujinxingia vulgaris]|uniref:Uncharacterized protein n=1 Tax=Lujinxingia vulgaris TaxID=2600176 RepID=A0A5C6XBX4_9DELT|nr:hypothetical protein [Lujinxingia vulgaris]TXD34869.1 hypothetical protein FRC96_12475 [Lujinxingia vulgaris]